MTLSHDIVICTKNRPDDLRVALGTVALQRRPPDTVIVVDASDDEASRRVVDEWSRTTPDQALRWIAAEPGLPRQRNLGAAASSADVLHFIDDDVELSPDYCGALVAVLEQRPDVVGVGGLVTNWPPRTVRPWWRAVCLDSTRQGAVLASGVNVIVHDAQAPLQVQWLSGCSMTYRRELVLRLRFDEALPGYALMEDADFGYRASKHGLLVVEPAAPLRHNVSPVGRWGAAQAERVATSRRAWFVVKNMGRWNRVAFLYSVLAGAVVQVVVSVLSLRRSGVKVAWWRLLGLVDYARGAR